MTAPGLDLFNGAGSSARADREFAEFYRARLRRAVGARVRSAHLLAAHLAWAQQSSRESISYKSLRRLMRLRGHRHFLSDGAWYGDVEILPEDAVEPAGNGGFDDCTVLDLVARIDAISAELAELRARLTVVSR